MNNTEIDYIRNNRGLVRFPLEMKVPEYMVSNFNRPINMEPLMIDIKEICVKNDTNYVLSNIINYQNDNIKNNSIILEMLDPSGIVIYSIKYNDIIIKKIELSDFDYEDNKVSIIRLIIHYNHFEFLFK